MVTLKSGNFDIIKKILRNWKFDHCIYIENSIIKQQISDYAYIKGDLSSVLGNNVDIFAMIEKDTKSKIDKLPSTNDDVIIISENTLYRISKGQMTINLNRLPKRKATLNIPDLSSFKSLGTKTQLSGNDLVAFINLAKNQDYMRCYLDSQNDFFMLKNSNDDELDLGHTKMAPGPSQEQVEQQKKKPAVVLLSFMMQHLFGETINIDFFREVSNDDINRDRYWGQFEMEIDSNIKLTLIELLQKAPMRLQ